jgi:hypothetical protein
MYEIRMKREKGRESMSGKKNTSEFDEETRCEKEEARETVKRSSPCNNTRGTDSGRRQ